MPEPQAHYDVLALDLEGTLISNAVSQLPRAGLYEFLEFCRELVPRIVIYTAVNEPTTRRILTLLAEEGAVPSWLPKVDYVDWTGPYKDLRLVGGVEASRVLLVDDNIDYVAPAQRGQWIPVRVFSHPYDEDDELIHVRERLLKRCGVPPLP